MVYIPYSQRNKKDEKERTSNYVPFSQRNRETEVDIRDPLGVKKLIFNASLPSEKKEEALNFGVDNTFDLITDGYQFTTKTSTPQTVEYGTVDALQDLFYRKQVEVRNLFGREEDTSMISGILPAAATSLTSRILEATPRIALATVANYNVLKTGGKDRDIKTPFDITRLGFEVPEGIDRTVLSDTGTRMVEDFSRRMVEHPDKAKTNIALSVLNTAVLDAFDATGIGGLVESGAVRTLRATQFNPAVKKAMQQLGLEGKDLTVEAVKEQFITRAENIIKAGGDINELNELGRSTQEVLRALGDEGIPQLNSFGQFMENASVFVTQDISKGVQWGVPRFRPLGETPRPQAETALPGYRREPGQAPAFGLSTERVEPVGFGNDGKPKETPDLTTKVIDRVGDRENVSRQFIEDLTNAPDLKQVERDMVRSILAGLDGETINVAEFVQKMREELLPLNRTDGISKGEVFDGTESRDSYRYENITLPEDVRGDVANYSEHIYESPIKTSAGEIHFGDQTDSYFAHTRIEDMADDEIRRVIEIQSDLMQRGRLERSVKAGAVEAGDKKLMEIAKDAYSNIDKLSVYRNTWFERIIREEVKRAAEDGIKKLQFPAGETAMKIEGLVSEYNRWNVVDGDVLRRGKLSADEMEQGLIITDGSIDNQWAITEVAGEGKFRAVQDIAAQNDYDFYQYLDRNNLLDDVRVPTLQELQPHLNDEGWDLLNKIAEQFDISGKVDTENPIYKFYEKDVARFLRNKYGAKRVTDDQGVEWNEVEVKPEYKDRPIEAFGAGAGVEEDEDGNISVDPIKLGMGFLMGRIVRKSDLLSGKLKTLELVPKQVFHGTTGKGAAAIIREGFKAFDGTWGKGIYFGGDREVVQKYYVDKFKDQTDGVMVDAEVVAENPLVLDKKYTGLFDLAKNDPELQKLIEGHKPGEDPIDLVTYAKNQGYDSIFAKDVNELVVFDDAQVKKITIDGDVIRDARQAEIDEWGQPASPDLYDEMVEILPGETDEMAALRVRIEDAALEIELNREALENMPASGLAPYVIKRGEFKGELPEVLGTTPRFSGQFSKRGDDIVTELGFDDTEQARAAWLEFVDQQKLYKEMVEDFRGLKNELKALKYAEKEKDAFLTAVQKEITQRLNKKIYSRWQMKDRVGKAIEKGVAKGEKIGQRAGYAEAKKQITNRLRNSFGIHLERMKRSAELDKLKVRIIERNRDMVREDLTEYIKASLPVQERGRYISMVKNADSQRKLIKAYTRIDAAVEDLRRGALIKDINKKVKKLSEMPSVAVEYRKQISDIVADFTFTRPTKKTINRLRKVREVVERQKAAGQDVTIPERLLRQMEVLAKKNIDNQRTADLINLSETIDLLAHLGKTKQATRMRLYEAEKERRLESLLAETVRIDKHPLLENRPGERLTLRQRFNNVFPSVLNAAQHVDLSLAPMDVFFDFLGGARGTYESAPSRIFKATTDANYSSYLDQKDPILNRVWEKVTQLGLDQKNFERIGIHAARVQKDGIEKLINTGVTEAEINSLELSPAEMELYETMRAEMEAIKPEIDDVMRTVYNKDVGQVENYFSFMTDFDAMSETEVFQRLGGNEMQEFGYATKNVEQGFTKSRTGAGKQKIKLDAMEIFTKHIDNAVYLVNMARDNKMLFEIANSPEFGKAAGDLGQRYTLEWIDTISRKGGKAGDERIAALDMLRRNVGAAYLGFKLSSAIIQPTALLDGASEIGTWAFRGASDIGRSRGARKFVLDHFPEIRARVGDDPAYLEMGSNETINRVRDSGYYVLKKLDSYTASAVGWGAYLQKAQELGYVVRIIDNGADDYATIFTNKAGQVFDGDEAAKIHQQALEYAQRVVRNTQASSFFKDAPRAITRGAFSGNRSVDRALFQFQTFVLRRWYRIRHDLLNAGIREKNPKKAFNIIFYLTLAYLAEEGLRRASTELVDLATGNDSSANPNRDGYTEAVVKSVLSTVPFVSQGLSMAIYRSDPIPGLGAIRSVSTGAYQAVSGASSTSKLKGLIELSEGIGASLGVAGAAQASQIAKNLVDPKKKKSSDSLDLDLDMNDDLNLDLDLDLDLDLGI